MSRSSTTIAERPPAVGPVRRLRAHPGEVLREELMKPLGLSANALALALRVPATRIGAIIRERRPRAVTADTALRLSRYFAWPAEVWLNLQTGYDRQVTEDEMRTVLERIKPCAQAT